MKESLLANIRENENRDFSSSWTELSSSGRVSGAILPSSQSISAITMLAERTQRLTARIIYAWNELDRKILAVLPRFVLVSVTFRVKDRKGTTSKTTTSFETYSEIWSFGREFHFLLVEEQNRHSGGHWEW